MRTTVCIIMCILGLQSVCLVFPPVSLGQDMRELSVEARKARQALKEKAEAEKAKAQQEAAEARARIAQDREKLTAAVNELKQKNQALNKDIEAMSERVSTLRQENTHLSKELSEKQGMVKELVGVIRINAKDIDSLVSGNPRTAMNGFSSSLQAVAEEEQFPGMDEIRNMAQTLLGQIQHTGQVAVEKGNIVDRSGHEVQAEVLFLGPFTAAYRMQDETGFLKYSTSGKELYALSHLPSAGMQDQLGQYMDGESKATPMDITRGAALRQLTHQLELETLIPQGGPVIWPILAVLGVGVLIILERILFLLRKRFNAAPLMQRIEKLSAKNDWQACIQACAQYARKPVARVLKAGLSSRQMQREEMENALQEAILKEIPPMERFLSTLGMLAAIAPLLGLLGTVIGMIETFHVITLHGTGDPRLMSGGISEALVTTMLGLSVAIPLMLSQTLLNRAVDKHIGQMEEKAVSLVNIIHKNRDIA